MYQARIANGDIINSMKLPKDFRAGTPIICLHCGEQLIMKHSRLGKPYFSHIKRVHSQGETVAHWRAKNFY